MTVAGQNATVYYSLAAPGLAGVYLVAFQMPSVTHPVGLCTFFNLPLQVAVGATLSNVTSFPSVCIN